MITTAPRPRSTAPATEDLPSTGVAAYDGTVRHRRFSDPAHTFERRVSYTFFDVDALPRSLDPLPLWSARRPAPVRFRRTDHFDRRERPLGPAIRDLVGDRTGNRPEGPVWLLTQLRRSGWLFNPLSVYFCYSAGADRLVSVVLEVSNTPWRERCWYVIDIDPAHSDGPWSFPKTMHVSPFLEPGLTYRLRTNAPGERLGVHLDALQGDRRLFAADLVLARHPLDARHAVTSYLRHPLATWQVSGAIYRQALRLWARGAHVHAHPHQRGDATTTGAHP